MLRDVVNHASHSEKDVLDTETVLREGKFHVSVIQVERHIGSTAAFYGDDVRVFGITRDVKGARGAVAVQPYGSLLYAIGLISSARRQFTTTNRHVFLPFVKG